MKSKDETRNDKDSCPLEGDISNSCKDCAYSPDFIYNPKTGECERRK